MKKVSLFFLIVVLGFPVLPSWGAITTCGTSGNSCVGNGNDKESDVLAIINAHLNSQSSPLNSLTLLGKSDDSNPFGNVIATTFKDGTEPIGGMWDAGSEPVSFISIKADGGFKVWDFMGATSGDWDTLGFGNNPPHELSHISFWDNPNAPPVPVPAAVWLLGTGLAGILGGRRMFVNHD